MKKNTKAIGKHLLIFAVSLNLLTALPAIGSIRSLKASKLSESERNSMRYELEILFNEVDLLIKNQKSNLSNLKRQETDIEGLKVYERIPFKRDESGLKEELKRSAQAFQVTLAEFKTTRNKDEPLVHPRQTHLSPQWKPESIAEQIGFRAVVRGPEISVKNWVRAWKTDQMRLIELDSKDENQSIVPLKNQRWEIYAHAFRFKPIKPPEFNPKSPRELLPSWAKRDPKSFSSSEPLLWNYVIRTEALIPKAKPYFQSRSKFMLNDAQMNFFLSKALPQ
jgi:hypothetical protein